MNTCKFTKIINTYVFILLYIMIVFFRILETQQSFLCLFPGEAPVTFSGVSNFESKTAPILHVNCF